jgi:hypothetical protein
MSRSQSPEREWTLPWSARWSTVCSRLSDWLLAPTVQPRLSRAEAPASAPVPRRSWSFPRRGDRHRTLPAPSRAASRRWRPSRDRRSTPGRSSPTAGSARAARTATRSSAPAGSPSRSTEPPHRPSALRGSATLTLATAPARASPAASPARAGASGLRTGWRLVRPPEPRPGRQARRGRAPWKVASATRGGVVRGRPPPARRILRKSANQVRSPCRSSGSASSDQRNSPEQPAPQSRRRSPFRPAAALRGLAELELSRDPSPGVW